MVLLAANVSVRRRGLSSLIQLNDCVGPFYWNPDLFLSILVSGDVVFFQYFEILAIVYFVSRIR